MVTNKVNPGKLWLWFIGVTVGLLLCLGLIIWFGFGTVSPKEIVRLYYWRMGPGGIEKDLATGKVFAGQELDAVLELRTPMRREVVDNITLLTYHSGEQSEIYFQQSNGIYLSGHTVVWFLENKAVHAVTASCTWHQSFFDSMGTELGSIIDRFYNTRRNNENIVRQQIVQSLQMPVNWQGFENGVQNVGSLHLTFYDPVPVAPAPKPIKPVKPWQKKEEVKIPENSRQIATKGGYKVGPYFTIRDCYLNRIDGKLDVEQWKSQIQEIQKDGYLFDRIMLMQEALSENVVKGRNQLLEEASEKLKTGLEELAKTYPQLNESFKGFNSIKDPQFVTFNKDSLSVKIANVELNDGDTVGPILKDNEYFFVLFLKPAYLGSPKQELFQTHMPNLKLGGNARFKAGDEKLEQAFKDLVEEVFAPLWRLNGITPVTGY